MAHFSRSEMEVIAVHHYLARTVELCCQTPSSLRTINYIYGLRVTVQLPAVGMKFSGPRHPLVRHLPFVKEIDVDEKNIGGSNKKR